MIRKVILTVVMVNFLFLLSSCGLFQTEVDYVELHCDSELYVGDIGDYEVHIFPSDADNQGFSISIDDASIINFTANYPFNGQYEAYTLGETWIHVYTDDGGHYDSCQVIVQELPN